MVRATPKQKSLIKNIETIVGVMFRGVSSDEASAFIDRHKGKYQRILDRMQTSVPVFGDDTSSRQVPF